MSEEVTCWVEDEPELLLLELDDWRLGDTGLAVPGGGTMMGATCPGSGAGWTIIGGAAGITIGPSSESDGGRPGRCPKGCWV